jgi:hypothetical protein
MIHLDEEALPKLEYLSHQPRYKEFEQNCDKSLYYFSGLIELGFVE